MVIQHQFPADYPAFPIEGDAVYPADPEELAVLLNVALIFLCYAVYVWNGSCARSSPYSALSSSQTRSCTGRSLVFLKR